MLLFLEWFLFELVRAPHRPPQDMTTFLGTEKYMIMAIMVLMAATSGIWIAYLIVHHTWTSQDIGIVLSVGASLSLLLARAALMPSWPVTPWHLILR